MYAPRKVWVISKVRMRDDDLAKVVLMAERSWRRTGTRPCRGGQRRSEALRRGDKKEATADAVRQAQTNFSQFGVDSSGAMWWKAAEAARFDVKGLWKKRIGWDILQAELNITIGAINDTAASTRGPAP